MFGPFIDLGPRRRVLASLIEGYEILDPVKPCAVVGLCGFPRRLIVSVRNQGPACLYDEAMDTAIEQMIAAGIAPETLRAEKYLPAEVTLTTPSAPT